MADNIQDQNPEISVSGGAEASLFEGVDGRQVMVEPGTVYVCGDVNGVRMQDVPCGTLEGAPEDAAEGDVVRDGEGLEAQAGDYFSQREEELFNEALDRSSEMNREALNSLGVEVDAPQRHEPKDITQLVEGLVKTAPENLSIENLEYMRDNFQTMADLMREGQIDLTALMEEYAQTRGIDLPEGYYVSPEMLEANIVHYDEIIEQKRAAQVIAPEGGEPDAQDGYVEPVEWDAVPKRKSESGFEQHDGADGHTHDATPGLPSSDAGWEIVPERAEHFAREAAKHDGICDQFSGACGKGFQYEPAPEVGVAINPNAQRYEF